MSTLALSQVPCDAATNDRVQALRESLGPYRVPNNDHRMGQPMQGGPGSSIKLDLGIPGADTACIVLCASQLLDRISTSSMLLLVVLHTDHIQCCIAFMTFQTAAFWHPNQQHCTHLQAHYHVVAAADDGTAKACIKFLDPAWCLTMTMAWGC